jgi:hypothetical protein
VGRWAPAVPQQAPLLSRGSSAGPGTHHAGYGHHGGSQQPPVVGRQAVGGEEGPGVPEPRGTVHRDHYLHQRSRSAGYAGARQPAARGGSGWPMAPPRLQDREAVGTVSERLGHASETITLDRLLARHARRPEAGCQPVRRPRQGCIKAVAGITGVSGGRWHRRGRLRGALEALSLLAADANPRVSEAPSHARESFCVKLPAGARPVVCPCIAVMGLVPAARDRVGETTGGAAHDERRDHRGVLMPRRARPGRQPGSPQRMLRRRVFAGRAGCRA